MKAYPGKLALQQRVLPSYRAAFLDQLAQKCAGGLQLFAGQPLSNEGISPVKALHHARLHQTRNFHLFHPRHPFYLCWQTGLRDWLANTDPDALVIEANPRYPSTYQAIQWMHSRGRPVIGWGLGAPGVAGLLSEWRTRSRYRLLSSLDGLIAYSRQGASEYRRLGILPPGRIFVASNAAAPRPAESQPERPPLPERPLTALFVGRLQARKRVDLLLRACARLPEPLQPKLVIVGEGPARQALETLAKSIYPQVKFVGAKHGPELEPIFSGADIFVLPGTGGLAVQEAMAHALPVVVAEGDGTQADLVRPENGWLVRPGDLSALSETLEKALTNPARLREMGAESFRIVSQEINLENMVKVFIGALHEAAFRR